MSDFPSATWASAAWGRAPTVRRERRIPMCNGVWLPPSGWTDHFLRTRIAAWEASIAGDGGHG